jgi:Ca2+-binding RTX toxin-like protein
VRFWVTVALALAAFALAAGRVEADPIVAAAGDIACDPENSLFGGTLDAARCQDRGTADLVSATAPTTVLALGDQQYCCGSLSQFNASYNRTWGRFKANTRPAAGNHEYRTPGAGGYFDYFNGGGSFTGPAGDRDKGYYSFDLGRWHLVALNSNCKLIPPGPAADGCAAGSPQEEWLRTDLASHPSACTLAYWHHPRFSSSGNSTFMRTLWNDLHAAGAEVALSGHEHNYERFAPMDGAGVPDALRGVRQFVVGTGGESFTRIVSPSFGSEARSSDTFGILQLALHATAYDWRFVPEAGRTFTDAGAGLCHGTALGIRVPASAGGRALSVDASGTPVASGVRGSVKCTIVGSPLDDLLVGTSGKDVICGLGGNDRVEGLGEADLIIGGPGQDRILGGAGDDTIFGNAGDDLVDGGSGDDRVYSGSGRDHLLGGSGDDRLIAGVGADRLEGGSGDDGLDGGRGRDVLDGGSQDDRLYGQGGDDRLDGGTGEDRLWGQKGKDRLTSVDGKGGDSVNGGPGRDSARIDRRDRARGVERVRRLK